jgi:hypothetical protein
LVEEERRLDLLISTIGVDLEGHSATARLILAHLLHYVHLLIPEELKIVCYRKLYYPVDSKRFSILRVIGDRSTFKNLERGFSLFLIYLKTSMMCIAGTQ